MGIYGKLKEIVEFDLWMPSNGFEKKQRLLVHVNKVKLD